MGALGMRGYYHGDCGMIELRFNITPLGKPTMTQHDKYARKPCVLRYWAFCEECQLKGVTVQVHDDITFVLPMPASWSAKKKAAHDGKPHLQKPDTSNMLKAIEDAVHQNDSHLWHYSGLTKVWGYEGAIIIRREA